jgi:hypothetical protein
MLDFSGYSGSEINPEVAADADLVEDLRDWSVYFGYVDLNVDPYGDGGYTTVINLLPDLRPSQNRRIRGWADYLTQLGPGTVELKGGADGIRFSLPDDKAEAFHTMMRSLFGVAGPVGEGDTWLGFSSYIVWLGTMGLVWVAYGLG